MVKVPVVTQKPSAEPFWKTKVQRGGEAATIETVMEKLVCIEKKIDALLEKEGISTTDPQETEGGWVINRGE